MRSVKTFRIPGKLGGATTISMLILAILCVTWEIWLAPMRPGAWILSLKALPLILALPGFWREHLRTYQWWSMLILLYMSEGLVRGASDPGFSAQLGWLEAGLSILIFGLILAFCRRELKKKSALRQAESTAT